MEKRPLMAEKYITISIIIVFSTNEVMEIDCVLNFGTEDNDIISALLLNVIFNSLLKHYDFYKEDNMQGT
ncbi:Regulator of RpoS [Xenorhabdus vietnamensis]|uniref:Regulator of RpoS n=1 Tax=Xenorhabdus vietnamensis TaxID=351656 RepID=A0A1Y2S8Z7_9GAMM|nr:Regulator of RpoS [Xenorhabdus vietnamensis]